ncbi:MAG: 2-oxopent-4-enoate hydratase [Candidatus Dadabacteria bacterium]|nr:MAG: 2-oxopent-4-enoate hydratase [Candidatus Dadabacteria bacterium]
MLPDADIARFSNELYEALRSRTTVAPLTDRAPDITVDDAYAISRGILERRLADGERVVGKKIGVTSAPVQDMLDVRTPDFGFLTDTMHFEIGQELPIGRELIQPRAEGELAFRLGRDLTGPGVTDEQTIAAIDAVMPCFEIVDSRIVDWKIRYEDTVADNASSGLYIIGEPVSPAGLDLAEAEMVVEKNGAFLSRGTGREALTGQPRLGSPVRCVTWLANTLGQYGIELKAGEIILSGSLVPLEPVVPGDRMTVRVEGVGALDAVFV